MAIQSYLGGMQPRMYDGRGSGFRPPVQPMQPPTVQPQVSLNPIAADVPQTMNNVAPAPQIQAQPMQTSQVVQQQVPQQQYGLSGFESALQAGLGAGVSALEQGQQSALAQLVQARGAMGGAKAVTVDPTTGQQFFTQAAEGVQAYSPAGLQAQQQQAALSGAMGPEAQQAAINAFNASPGQQFLREQGEQSLINQAAALGGLGGGDIRKELARFGTGLAQQDFANQFNRLGQLSGQGLQAAGMGGQFLSQAGQQQGNLASQNAQLGTQANLARAQGLSSLFGQGAGISSALAGQAAGMFGNIGSQIGQGRFQAGRDISQNIGQTTAGLSNLSGQQGGGLSDIIGSGAANLANLLSGAGQGVSSQDQQLAQLLMNAGIGEGTQLAGLQNQIGQAQAGGITGRADAIAGTTMDAAKLFAMSDERLKQDITKIEEVNGVNFYKWNWNGKLGLTGSAIGVIAQEIEKIIPSAVINTDSGYKAVDYKLVGDYINASI